MNHIWTWPIHFGHDHFILVVTKSLWSSPNLCGQNETILDQPKLFWSHRRTRHKCLTTYLLWSFENENKVKSYHWHEVLQHSLEKPFSILINWQISSSKYRSADYLWLLKNRSFGIYMKHCVTYAQKRYSIYSFLCTHWTYVLVHFFGAEF